MLTDFFKIPPFGSSHCFKKDFQFIHPEWTKHHQGEKKTFFFLYRKQMLRLYIVVFFTLDIVLESSLQEISFSSFSISIPILVSIATVLKCII